MDILCFIEAGSRSNPHTLSGCCWPQSCLSVHATWLRAADRPQICPLCHHMGFPDREMAQNIFWPKKTISAISFPRKIAGLCAFCTNSFAQLCKLVPWYALGVVVCVRCLDLCTFCVSLRQAKSPTQPQTQDVAPAGPTAAWTSGDHASTCM